MTSVLPLYTEWALVGDRSRYRFAAWLTEVSYESLDAKKCRIWIAQDVSTQENAEDVFLSSVHVPPGIRLCVLPDSDAAWTKQLAAFSFCLLCEEFPWHKESTEQILYALDVLAPRPVTALLLMKAQHRAGSTDLDKISETLAAARTVYQKQGLMVLTADSAHPSEVFSLRNSLLGRHREILRDELLSMRDRMDEFKAEDYDLFLAACDNPRGCLGVDTKEAVFSCRAARRSGENCLWAAWNQAALGLLFAAGRRGNLRELLEIYEKMLSESRLPFWSDLDVQKDREQLEAVLKAAFSAHMRTPAKYDKRIVWDAVRGESAYARLLLDGGAHIAYWKKYREFITESARVILLDRLNKYCKHWEEMIR